MKDGNLTILYTQETRSFLHSALYSQSSRAYKATEQQSRLQQSRLQQSSLQVT